MGIQYFIKCISQYVIRNFCKRFTTLKIILGLEKKRIVTNRRDWLIVVLYVRVDLFQRFIILFIDVFFVLADVYTRTPLNSSNVHNSELWRK